MVQAQTGGGDTPARPKEIGPDYGRGEYTSPRSAGDQMASAAGEFADQARRTAGATAEAMRAQGSQFAERAKDMAEEAGDRLLEKAGEQQRAGADYIGDIAATMKNAAGQFDQQLPFAANYMRSAATQVEHVADTLRNGDVRDLVRQAQQFAREQPTLFVGMSMLAGFGIVRLLKNSANADVTSAETTRGADERR
jgi:hypothetical protein